MKKIRQLCLFVGIVISAALIWMAMAGAAASAHANDVLISPESTAPHDVLATSHWRPGNLSDTADLTATTAVTIYLPLIRNFVPRVQAGIYGQVTYQGTEAGGIDLRLNRCFYDGTYWSCPDAYAQYTQLSQMGVVNSLEHRAWQQEKNTMCHGTTGIMPAGIQTT